MMLELKKLAYEYNALEPVISKETMTFHHDKHHQAYVDTANKLLEGTGYEEKSCPKCLLKDIENITDDADKKQKLINNLGGVLNHNLFWDTMTPGGSSEPVGELKAAIEEKFGSFDAFKKEFEEAGKGQFGSGWAWLVVSEEGLEVISTKNQDNPILCGKTPLLGNDVWEHAYYLDYQNARAKYLEEWWKVVNWDVAEERYQKNCK
uniref:superoxide dismutase n=1 Tax=Anaerococcus urinomassiliensis TaxID=1745712 RepID=UPI00116137F4|nr:superoxide dismutase [Anaerococcus urinomassiliensis]